MKYLPLKDFHEKKSVFTLIEMEFVDLWGNFFLSALKFKVYGKSERFF
jgi:hypothetical protein